MMPGGSNPPLSSPLGSLHRAKDGRLTGALRVEYHYIPAQQSGALRECHEILKSLIFQKQECIRNGLFACGSILGSLL